MSEGALALSSKCLICTVLNCSALSALNQPVCALL